MFVDTLTWFNILLVTDRNTDKSINVCHLNSCGQHNHLISRLGIYSRLLREEREAVSSSCYIQWEQSVDDLNGGYSKVVERILPGSPWSRWHAYFSEVWGRGVAHHCGQWSSQKALRWPRPWGGCDFPWVPQGSGCCWAVVVDTPLQHHVKSSLWIVRLGWRFKKGTGKGAPSSGALHSCSLGRSALGCCRGESAR